MSIRKHIPNAITSLNLVCGVIGIIIAMQGCMETAFLLMLAAMVFDFCDGLAARLLKVQSPCGKELDSLADVVSFGVLPAIMMLKSYDKPSGILGILIIFPLVIAVFSALRLAKFNIDERQHESFIGLPTPACALICGSLCCLMAHGSGMLYSSVWFIPAVSAVLCFLLVCELPMFSFKFGKDIKADPVTRMKRIAIVSISAIIVVMVVTFRLPWQSIILGILLAYILENVLFRLLAPGPSQI